MSQTPRQLGRYELIRRIAVGGMGEIYLARASGTAGFEKTVIIKTILPHLAEEEEFVEKFLDEGRIVVNLTHGNIVPVFDMDEADGEYFIAMEYVPGRDMRDVLKRLRERDERMPPDLAAYVVSKVCAGLGYAHRKTDDEGNPLDIVHRDVSPSNVLISTDGEVKIIDFGVARAADRRAKTVSGRLQGKCCYMSPEQARGDSLDHRSDIFSTGVVLYEMVTRVRPFEGDSDLKSLDLVRDCEYDPPSVLEPTIPEELDVVVERAMAEDPDDRYDTIDEMKVDLMEFLVSRGQTITSRDVAEFLSDLFPEGLERDAFRELREEAGDPSDPMDLDEALEHQLDQLQEEEIDPLDETLPDDENGESPAVRRSRTETITPESGVDTKDEPGTSVDAESSEGESESKKRPESSPDDVDSREEDDRLAPAANRNGGASRSSRIWTGLGIGVALVAAIVGYAIFGGERRGSLSIRTEPVGATVHVDGSEIKGGKTPREVRLPPGMHEVTVSKEGFRSERFQIELDSGEQETITTNLPKKKQNDSGGESRTFVVETKPPDAIVTVDGERRGNPPTSVEVSPEQVRLVEATHPKCRDTEQPVAYDRQKQVVSIELRCGGSKGDASSSQASGTGASGDESPAGRAPSDRVEITFRSDPTDATVRVNDEKLGATPVSATYRRDASLRVQFSKSGYTPVKKDVDVGSVEGREVRVKLEKREMGCLNFFAVHPQYNEIAVDGKWLEGRHQKLRNYELPPGKHEIRVRNPEAGKDETFSFRIEPGNECTSLTVWDPDEG